MKLLGRAVSPGHATGSALVSGKPLSFLGGVSLDTGVISDPGSDVFGESVAGRVLAFPHGKGSTVGSYVLYGLVKRGIGPVGIVNAHAEGIVAAGAILAGVPLVDSIDVSVLMKGDIVTVDGDRGSIALPRVSETRVATAFVRNRGRILVLRRGRTAPTFPGLWSGVSGVIERNERPIRRARTEVREETGIRNIRLRATGPIVYVRHEHSVIAVSPFLFDAPSRRVELNWENEEVRWVTPSDLARLETVPRLREAFDAVSRAR